MNTIPPHIVAALDHMLVAVGRWQADPSPKTWARKLDAIRAYLAIAEDNPQ
jgi:hypothetical protein